MSFAKLKNYISARLYFLVLFAAKFFPAKAGEKNLLLIKTDEIGDYVMFHQYFKYIRKSDKYHGYKITLVGSQAWKDLFLKFDMNSVDEVIWLNKKKFKSDLQYRFSFLRTIRSLPISDVINLIYSRSILFDDAIAWVATGVNKTAMLSDYANQTHDLLKWDKRIYNSLIDAGDNTIFDTIRSRNFIVALTGMNLIPLSTRFELDESFYNSIDKEFNLKSGSGNVEFVDISNGLFEKYYILFLGAGHLTKKWELAYFVTVAEYISAKYQLAPILCGGPEDVETAKLFLEKFNEKAIDLVGKTTLVQMVSLSLGARFLIAVDTSALHIAAAVNRPVIGLYSGKSYGRFAPYPREIAEEFYAIFPDKVDELIRNNDPILKNNIAMKYELIRTIPPEKLYPYIDKIMAVA